MITIDDYWMGRDKTHPLELSVNIRKNAQRTVDLINLFIATAKLQGVLFKCSPRTLTPVVSGWRPPSYNTLVPGAAKNSLHMTGEACDLYDPLGEIDKYCMSPNNSTMKDIGLWLEHPDYTIGWCHLQTKPPKSGNRVFRPF